MGLLDDAIREHLDLKRQHGAGEDELARQEAEALGPVTEEDLAAGGAPGADESEAELPFDRVTEDELPEELAEPSVEWTGTDPDDIDVPSFVPAEPRSDPPADELEPLEEPWSDLGEAQPPTEAWSATDPDVQQRSGVGEVREPPDAAPGQDQDEQLAASAGDPEPPDDEVSVAAPELEALPDPEAVPFEPESPPREPSSAELVEPEIEPFEPAQEREPTPLDEARDIDDDLPHTEAFQAVDLQALRAEAREAELEGAPPAPAAPEPVEVDAPGSGLDPQPVEPEPGLESEFVDAGGSLESQAEPPPLSALEPDLESEPLAPESHELPALEPEPLTSEPLDPEPLVSEPLEPEPLAPRHESELPLEGEATLAAHLPAEESPFTADPAEPSLEAEQALEPAPDFDPTVDPEVPLGPDPAAEQGSPPEPIDEGPVTQVWSIVDEPGLAPAPAAAEDEAMPLEREPEPMAEGPVSYSEPSVERPVPHPDPVADEPVADDPALPDPLNEGSASAGFDPPHEGNRGLDPVPIEERPVFEPSVDAEEGPAAPLAPPSQAPSVPEPLDADVELEADEGPSREQPVAARGFFEETEEHETLWYEERPDPDFEN